MSQTEPLSPVVQYLELAAKHAHQHSPLLHKNMETFVLRFGRPYVPQSLPPTYKRGRPQGCFDNCYRAILRDRNLIYVEGYASIGEVEFGILHAWCVERGSNKVLELTSDNFTSYYGIPFKREYVLAHRRKRGNMNTLIDNWGAKPSFPLLRLETLDGIIEPD